MTDLVGIAPAEGGGWVMTFKGEPVSRRYDTKEEAEAKRDDYASAIEAAEAQGKAKPPRSTLEFRSDG